MMSQKSLKMRGKIVLMLFLMIQLCVAFYQAPRFSKLFLNKWLRNDVAIAKMRLSLASVERASTGASVAVADEPPSSSKLKTYKPDLSAFSVGQQFDAKVVSTHPFGVFVDISRGVNVLLPKSKLGKQFDQLKTMLDNKSNETVKISLTDVSQDSGKIAGMMLRSNKADLNGDDAAWEGMRGKDIIGQSFNTTVISVHNFGLFVKVEEFGVQGLVPLSKLPVKTNLRDVYPAGSVMQVTVEDLTIESKKMVLSAVPRPDVRAFVNFPEEKWIQSVIQSVNSFGLFVRPAGYDVVGLVRRNQIPQDLLKTVRNVLKIERREQTVLEELFGAGDVVRVRIEKLDIEGGKVEFSMLPIPQNVEAAVFDEDDSDFAELKEMYGSEEEMRVEATEEPTTSSSSADEDFNFKSYRDEDDDDDDEDAVAYDDEDEGHHRYDPLTTLVWWRGKPFAAALEEFAVSEEGEEYADDEEDLDEDDFMEGIEEAVASSFSDAPFITESPEMVQGAWRRLLSLDEGEVDDTKQKEADKLEDIQEMELEIGVMNGFDEEIDRELPIPFMSNHNSNKFGAFINFDDFPEWKEKSSWYETHEKPLEKVEKIRLGKNNDVEWEKELDELEKSLKFTRPVPVIPVEQLQVAEEASTEEVIESIIAGTDSMSAEESA